MRFDCIIYIYIFIYFFFFPENRIRHFTQFGFFIDNLHEMSNTIFWKETNCIKSQILISGKKIYKSLTNLSSAEFAKS